MARDRSDAERPPQARTELDVDPLAAQVAVPSGQRGTLTPVVARLTGLNGLLMLLALLTGPIQARALGVDGRGEIAVIVTLFTLAPLLLDFGLSEFVARERARGTSLGTVLGTALPLALGFSMVGVLAAGPVSELLAQDRPVVERFTRLAMLTLPLWITGWLLSGAARGDGRWAIVYRQRIITAGGTAAAIVGLAVLGRLTVESLAIATFMVAIPAVAVTAPVVRGAGPWRFDARLVRPGLSFGARSWALIVATQGNYRLDQLIMAAVVSSRQLGLYAVAVGFTSVLSSFVSAVTLALMPRVAREGAESVPRVTRLSAVVLASGLAAVAITSPLVVPLLFGQDFVDAVALVAVLTAGALALGLSVILGAALQGHGRPQDAMRPQLAGLIVTIVGLAIALEPLEALGAALVSVVAYTVVLAGTVRAATREFGCSARDLLIARPGEMRLLATVGRRALLRR